MSVSARLGARISAPPVLGPALAVEARLDVDGDQRPLAQGRERAQRQVVDERAVDEQPPPPDLGWRKHRHAHAEPHAVRRRADRLTTNWPERRSRWRRRSRAAAPRWPPSRRRGPASPRRVRRGSARAWAPCRPQRATPHPLLVAVRIHLLGVHAARVHGADERPMLTPPTPSITTPRGRELLEHPDVRERARSAAREGDPQ